MAASMSRCEASGSWKPVKRPSTTRTPRSGVMTRSVQLRVGMTSPDGSAAVSSARTTVGANCDHPAASLAGSIHRRRRGWGYEERLVVRTLMRFEAGDPGVERQSGHANSTMGQLREHGAAERSAG